MKTDQLLLRDKSAFAKIDPPCQYFGTCGGCSIQDLAYADQLVLKKQRLLRMLGELDPAIDVEVIGLEEPWRYRNKAELTFGTDHSNRVMLGYHAARSFWRIVDLEDCLLLPEPIGRMLADARRLAENSGRPAYNPRTHQGFFRYLLIRASHSTGKLLVCLITTQGNRDLIERFGQELMARHPAISSFYWGVNEKVADVAIPDEFFLISGEPYLEDRLGPFKINLHPLNFLQPNPLQAQRMYLRLQELVGRASSAIAWDLYCGIGLISFYLASMFRMVYGIDWDAHNLEMARLNAEANAISNVQFHLGRTEDLLANKRFWLMEAQPELVVVDPPRSGLHPRVVGSLLAARPKQLLYLSCNAQALVRDLQLLLSGFPRYRLRQVDAFDLFPHTVHLEVLTLLERA